MHIFKEIAPLKAHLKARRTGPVSVGFVPTMGALHDGHVSLVRASQQANTVTVCSIYVNPTQFGNPEDLAKYPRTLEKDLQILDANACDIVFCPETEEMYGTAGAVAISFPGLDTILEGEFRPGHFSGVAQVVAKLFHIVQPDRAYFGQKDFQQVAIISRMVTALNFDGEIVSMPIVREPDGLAMSSRNQRLTPEQRRQATILHASLQETRVQLRNGKSLSGMIEVIRSRCAGQDVKLEYLALVDRENFTLLETITGTRAAVILIAAQVGPVRLIDNLFLD